MAQLRSVFKQWEAGRGCIDVLEAGGGSSSHLPGSTPRRVTVIDESPEQLARNVEAAHRILGDLHTVDIPAESYDVAVAWDVIEHLRDPALVMRQMTASLRPGGLLVIAAPVSNSLAGLITKHTPHSFHVMIHRRLFKNHLAGTPGHAPFPTFHNPAILPGNIRRLADDCGLETVYLQAYESSRRAHLGIHAPVMARLFDVALWTSSVLTGRRTAESDFFFVGRKPDVLPA